MPDPVTVAPVPGIAGREHRLWKPEDVREFLCGQFTLKTLANWRTARTGPPFTLIGNRPFYRPEAVIAWAAKRERATAAGEVA